LTSTLRHRFQARAWRGLAAAALAACAASSALAQSSYGVTELKPFFLGDSARGLALSSTGAVVGFANVLTGYKFEVYSGIVGDYAMSGVLWPWNTASTQAAVRVSRDFTPLDINASGVMLTSASTLWQNGKATPLNTGGTWSQNLRTNAMNASNDVAGAVASPYLQPAWWQSSGKVLKMLPLPPQADQGQATDINDAGQLVGQVLGLNQVQFAVRWTGGQVDWVGQPYTDALAINNSGWILQATGAPTVGSQTPPTMYALVKPDGTQVPLLDPSGARIIARNLNNRGDVVGLAADGRVIVRKQDGSIIDLKQLQATGKIKLPTGLTLSSCDHINDQGVLLCTSNGKGLRSFRLRPL
jgi:hypothetical protein